MRLGLAAVILIAAGVAGDAAAGAAPAPAPPRFDLICTISNIQGKGATEERHLRIDTGAATWCEVGKCDEGRPLSSTPTVLDLLDAGTRARLPGSRFQIDRKTGAYDFLMTDGQVTLSQAGTCSPLPYGSEAPSRF